MEGGGGYGVLEAEDALGRPAAPVSEAHVLTGQDLTLGMLL